MPEYFDLFQLPRQFELDENELEQRYHQLATQFHPDKFVTQSAFEQKQAMMMAATINTAYRTLKAPLDRAAYLLQQQGIDADAPEHTHFDAEFLMQQMQWREAIAEAGTEHNMEALNQLVTEISHARSELYRQLSQTLAASELNKAAEYVRQGRFLHKLQQELEQARL